MFIFSVERVGVTQAYAQYLGRFANKDTVLPRGGGKDGKSKIFVPKGASVDYSVYVMHHRKDIWGPDAEDFRPERWENRKAGWEFLPVNMVLLSTNSSG